MTQESQHGDAVQLNSSRTYVATITAGPVDGASKLISPAPNPAFIGSNPVHQGTLCFLVNVC